MEQMTKTTAKVNQDVMYEGWKREIIACRNSGMTVREWCIQNGINIKTYYYRLRVIRDKMIEAEPTIVPLNNNITASEKIEITNEDLNVLLPADINAETLSAIIRVLKNA